MKVGDEAQPIHIRETLLKENSEFFKAALTKKCQAREIELPTDLIEIVTVYADYLYPGTLTVDRTAEGLTDFYTLARLYCFGEKISDD